MLDHVTSKAQNIASFTDYLIQLKLQDLSLVTLHKYKQILIIFQKWLQERPISAYSVQLFLAEMRENGYSQNTIRLYYVTLKSFLFYLGIPLKLKLRRPHHLPPYHSIVELQTILNAIDEAKGTILSHKDRDKLIIIVLAYTGIRRAELLSLRPCDIQNGMLFVRSGKRDKDRVIPLAQTLSQPLNDYIVTNNISPSSRLFPISPQRLYDIVKHYSRLAGISDFHPHSLRHFFATTLIEQGAQLKAVQELMGHSDISSTAVYVDLSPHHLKGSIALLDESLSRSVSINNISKSVKRSRSKSLSLSLSNEQKGGKSICGLSSKKARPPRQPSISPPLKASQNTGQDRDQSFASVRDALTASVIYPNAGDIKPRCLSTELQPVGNLENKP